MRKNLAFCYRFLLNDFSYGMIYMRPPNGKLTGSSSLAVPGYLSRIRFFSIPDPGSRVKKIPGSAPASKNFSILNQKIDVKLSEI
jgi:hypothetical protein